MFNNVSFSLRKGFFIEMFNNVSFSEIGLLANFDHASSKSLTKGFFIEMFNNVSFSEIAFK